MPQVLLEQPLLIPADKDVIVASYVGSDGKWRASSPFWKYATPHNIRRVTPIQSTCKNCHDATQFKKFWLYDAASAAQGWLQQPYLADDVAANAGVVQTVDQ